MDTTAGGAPEAAHGPHAASPGTGTGPVPGTGAGAAQGPGTAAQPHAGPAADLAADSTAQATAPVDAGASVRALPGQDPRPGSGGSAVDAAGMVVLACCAVWALVCSAGREARPEGMLLALLAVTAGYAAGRVLGALLPALTLAAGAVAVLLVVLLPPHRLSDPADAPPLGYHNADAALLVLAAGAACCSAWGVRDRVWGLGTGVWRGVLRLVAAGCAVAALLLGSAAGFAAAAAVVLCSLAAARMRLRAVGLAGLALAALLAAGGSYAVAVHAVPGGLSESLTGQLTQPRVALWHEAVTLADRHPLRGVGPERFAEESTPLPTDTPTARTPRSAPLQLAAEQGVPGAALLAGAYLWTMCALWRSPRSTPVVLTAAAALTGLGLLATVDHVLSYTAVTASAGLLAGLATSRPLPAQGPPTGEPEKPPAP